MGKGVAIDRIKALAPSPSYVVDLRRLRSNLDILDEVQRRSGAKILLALKGFAMWSLFPLIRRTLHGVCASSVWEARLGCEEFGREVHTFSAGFTPGEMALAAELSCHMVFNSFGQIDLFRSLSPKPEVSVGLRVNPDHSEGHTPLYDPCSPGSRLGIKREAFEGKSLEGVEGLHFHTLCEHLFAPLARTAEAFEARFGDLLRGMKWLNLGGGHHITREGYDVNGLVELIVRFREKYNVEVYLEPGEAIVLDTGVLVGEVVDIVENDMKIAILNVSAPCHMPDVLEMPYRPPLFNGYDAGQKPHDYRLAGPSCLAGDVIGEWSFETPLRIGDRLVFGDMAHYTMVKNTTFNGVVLPAICAYEPETDKLEVIRTFDYEDFKGRLS